MDSFWKNKRVFVSGGGGFIGSHLAEALLERGACVRALIKYNSRNSWGYLDGLSKKQRQRCEIILGDITDPHASRKWVQGCDVVFHLAALTGIPYSYHAPANYIDVNVRGTLNLLEAARTENVPRFVHTSTSEAYGTALRVPIDEAHPLQAQSPYSASKIAADKLAESYHLSFDLPVVTVRPFNTFGPRQSARAVIPTIITQALTQNAVRLGSLEPIRDLTYIEDTVRGFLACAQCDGTVGKVVNLGTGTGIAVGDLVQVILDQMGITKNIETDSERIRPKNSEVMQLISNPGLAHELTGWKAEVPFAEGIERTIRWIQEHLDEYKAESYVV